MYFNKFYFFILVKKNKIIYLSPSLATATAGVPVAAVVLLILSPASSLVLGAALVLATAFSLVPGATLVTAATRFTPTTNRLWRH